MTYCRVAVITEWQRQVINGTIMGGSSIMKPKKGINCYLSMRGKNGKWLQCKANEMGLVLPPNPYVIEDKYFRWHSCCSPLFNEFYDNFYEEGKKVARMEILDGLRAIGLAVWFLDAGQLKDDQLFLSVKSFSNKDIISKYFQEIDIGNEIVKSKLIMDKKSTEKFVGIIGDYIPEFMLVH